MIDTNGLYSLIRLLEDGPVTLIPWRRHPALRPGDETNSLRLAVRGNAISIFLNGQHVAMLEDDAPIDEGDIQLFATSGVCRPGMRCCARRPSTESRCAASGRRWARSAATSGRSASS
ncbi:MAG: hypothetical protein HY332_25520 [Chloroflexi bacterium]|nr:hypothetical protein [Chloroflexota bacterium]